MSMVLSRSPLEPIGMNGASKRRSARLSAEGAAEDNEPPAKKTKVVAGAGTGPSSTSTTVNTKEQDGDAGAVAKRKKRVYEEDVDDFSFTRNRKSKVAKAPITHGSTAERDPPAKATTKSQPEQSSAPTEKEEPKTSRKKVVRRLPTTPERDAAEKSVRRSKRLSNENAQGKQASPHKPAHARSHANQERSPSPLRARPVTVEKKRRPAEDGVEEEKTMRIQLPFADTPVIKRNKEMRKASAENGSRRSSSGMRGRRASSLIDEGRGNGESDAGLNEVSQNLTTMTMLRANARGLRHNGFARPQSAKTPVKNIDKFAAMLNEDEPTTAILPSYHHIMPPSTEETFADQIIPNTALPHSEVPSAEFFKHISAELTEPRRMRCLLGWCGTRALPPKPEAPKDNTPASNLEFQALQAARVIQVELSQDLITKGLLSDWFSRDESVPPQVPLRRKPNPRNVANVAKVEELERELERLKKERAQWNELVSSATLRSSPSKPGADPDGQLSPLHPDLLDSPQRAILEQLQSATTESSTDPQAIQQRLRNISENLEFTVDQFADNIRSLKASRDTAERLASRTLDDAASLLEEREKEQRLHGRVVDPMDALRGLAKVLNSQQN